MPKHPGRTSPSCAIKWKNAEVEIWSDSSYVVKAINEGWLRKWESKGFVKVKNPDLWKRFLMIYRQHHVIFHWLKGHAGHPENERCDRLAVKAYSEGVLEEDNAYVESIETENICRTGKLL